MREILKLMFPIHFAGNIYHKAAMFICLPFLLAVFVASLWSNLHGIEAVFSGMPEAALIVAKGSAFLIDIVNWLCFSLFAVTVLSFSVVENLQDQLPIDLVKAMKPKLAIAAIIFFLLMSALTTATFILSRSGGAIGAEKYISEKHGLAYDADSLHTKYTNTLNKQLSDIEQSHKQRISDLSSRLNDAQGRISSNKDWAKRGKDWDKYNKLQKAKKDKAEAQAAIDVAYAAYSKEKVAIRSTTESSRAAAIAEYSDKKAKYDSKQQDAARAMAIAVKSWTLIGLIVQAVSFVLTIDLYRKSAYAFIRQELSAWNHNQQRISSELLKISAQSQLHTVEVSTPKQAASPARTEQATRISTEEQPLIQQADSLETLRQKIEQHEAISLDYVRKWKFAFADMAKGSRHGLTKKQTVQKFEQMLQSIPGTQQKTCSVSTVDNLRRSYDMMLAMCASEQELILLLDKI